MPGRRLDSVRLLTRHALSSRLRKWAEAPLSVGFFDDDDERRLERAGADVGGVALIDPLSLLRLGLQPNEHAVLVFEQPESGKRAERTVFLRARRQLRSPGVRVSRSLVFNLFHDTQLRDAVVSEIRPAADSPPDCTELWLNRLRSAEDERDATSEEGLDAEIVDFFHTPRLVHTEDVIAVQHAGLRGKREVFFKLAVGSSPSIASANTKIFRGAPRTARFPRRRVDSTRSFVPAGLRRTVARCCEILEPLVCDEKADGKPPIVFILVGGLGSGRRLAVDSIADRLAVNRLRFDAHDLWNAEGRPTDSVVSSWVDRINNLQPCVCELSNLSVLAGNSSVDLDSGTRVLDVLAAAIGNLRGRIAFFITTTKAELPAVPRPIAKLVHFEEHCAEVGEDDRREFAAFVRRRFRTDVPSEWLAEATRGATLAELRQLLAEAAVNAAADGRRELQRVDFERPLESRRAAFGEALGVPKVPNVTWDDVGGLEDVKQLIAESLRANLNPRRAANTRRSGVVLHGPPGCGKTLIAKAVANEFKMTFLSVKGPELLNQYVGQSEQNLRHVFEKARLAAPSVVFFDELDSLAPSRGVAGDSGGVMDRLVSQLLAELDDLQTTTAAVFVMGATNRPDLLDSCLLTPGRFDRLVEVRMATDRDSKVRILRPVCKNVNLADGLDVEKIADLCPPEMSGAELSALVAEAAMEAIREVIQRPPVDPKAVVRIGIEHVKRALVSLQ